MSDVDDEVLQEILLRLPHARSAVQCGLVCKRWSSLIYSDYFQTTFNQRQRHHHSRYLDPSYALPFTILFRFERKINDITFTSHKLSSEAPPGICHYPNPTDFLDFLPEDWPHLDIETSCDDLLLVSGYIDPMNAYCVCNPLTRQWHILPHDMPYMFFGYRTGLWCDPNQYGSNKQLGDYKVVVLDVHSLVAVGVDYVFRVAIFCSKTGEWSQRNLSVPKADALATGHVCFGEAVTSRGILYFPLRLMGEELTGFLALDPLTSDAECRVVDVPSGFGGGWRAKVCRVCVGVVRGRLRVSQLLKVNEAFDLKVWELLCGGDDESAAWVLVHDVSVKRDKRKTMFVVAFDPNNGDVIFVIMNNSICCWKMVC